MHQTSTYGYDEFNRLTSRTTLPANTADYTYNYDRWGNRWNQTVLDAGYNMSLTFNTANNQVSSYTYDAAGNLYNDGNHIYTYDAEGNLTKVDGGSTASYVYDALNHRVSTTVGSTITEFVFNQNGQRVSEWNGSTRTALKGHYYWGAKPVAYYDTTEVHFEHQDWQGTERMRTSYSGTVESSISTLPFGDGYSVTGTASTDQYGFAMLDYDSETETDHAQFRQYSAATGRWMRPDPYTGSYNMLNPQSMNRYAYVINNPLSYIDTLGLYFDSAGWWCTGSWNEDAEMYTYSCTPPDSGGGGDVPLGGGSGGGVGGGGGTIRAVSKACIVLTHTSNVAGTWAAGDVKLAVAPFGLGQANSIVANRTGFNVAAALIGTEALEYVSGLGEALIVTSALEGGYSWVTGQMAQSACSATPTNP